jgi:hypothetical protein
MLDWSSLLPPRNNDYRGHPLAFYFMVLIALRNTFRGSVHYFAPDGGSATIAGIPLETYAEGAVQTIITFHGVMGIGHLVEAALVWLVIFRYRALIPLAYVCLIASEILGFALLAVKPLPVLPPGQIGLWVLAPLSVVFFLLSIRKPKRALAPDAPHTSPSAKMGEPGP